jgi:hypothetical protein
MPRATATVSGSERFDLKTLPEGFVELRRLTYGQKLERRAMSSVAQAEGGGKGKNFRMSMAMLNEQATIFDFTHCIVDHNLEDDSGQKMDLTNVLNIRRLDPRVGDEIESLIDKLNNFEEEDEVLGNLGRG